MCVTDWSLTIGYLKSQKQKVVNDNLSLYPFNMTGWLYQVIKWIIEYFYATCTYYQTRLLNLFMQGNSVYCSYVLSLVIILLGVFAFICLE